MNIFEQLGISNQLLESIRRLGFQKPTQIQEKSIPLIIQNKDVIGESATGSGKTLAFGCGISNKVIQNQGLQALILTPTRELAEQVKDELNKLARNLRTIAVYGGVSINPQIHQLQRAEVVVGTPGRILDHLERRTINTSRIKILVLDEADRMLDMGFIDDVSKIAQTCPRDRQTLFFSATISRDIKHLANRFMINPIEVRATRFVDPTKLKQTYYNVQKNMKLSLLTHLLKNEQSGLVMVFCRTRSTTDFVIKNLKANKIRAVSIHGGMTQNKRSRTIDLFNKGKVGILVCTDVAARGLHIENVSHIYNYEIPKDPKDYVHRIGRTARAGEEGKVINLLCENDHENFGRVQYEYPSFKIRVIQTPYIKKVFTIRINDRRPQGRFPQRNRFSNRRNFSRPRWKRR